MSRRLLLLMTSVCCSLFSGCAVHQIRDDQDKMRLVLLELYTNQVMDNLVRAVNGLPIIQLDYTNVNSQVTVDANVAASDALATSHANTLTVVALKSLLVTRNLANTLTGSTGLTNSNQVAVTATPVTTSNELYDAYLRYLAEPGSLQVSECRPPKGAAHLCVRFEKKYYWVPMEFRDLFFDLASITTAQRGKALLPPDKYYSVTLVDVVKLDEPVKAREDGVFVLPIKLNKTVPAALGHVEFSDGITAEIAPYHPNPKEFEYSSSELRLYLDPLKAPLGMKTPGDLKSRFPLPVKLFLGDKNAPYLQPTTKELLDRIPFQTPQVSLDSHTDPTPPVQPSATSMLRPRFLQPQAVADAN